MLNGLGGFRLGRGLHVPLQALWAFTRVSLVFALHALRALVALLFSRRFRMKQLVEVLAWHDEQAAVSMDCT